MTFFFERHESDSEITITHKPWWLYIAALLIITMWVPSLEGGTLFTETFVSRVAFLSLIALVTVRFTATRSIRKETYEAIRNGSAGLSGSKFSPGNPLAITVSKQGRATDA